MDSELQAIEEVLRNFKIEPFVFVDKFKFFADQERQMMQQAIHSIDNCDLLIAETNDKGIGIGIEVGYAKAKDKPVIYLRNQDADHSTTVSGISDFQIVYKDVAELKRMLNDVLSKLF